MAIVRAKRPPLPDPLMREVRQRCGFGCIVCGLPLYEYDHLIGWAETQRHVAAEIALLCNRHHREKTSGLLPPQAVIEANAAPHNLRTGIAPPLPLHYGGSSCAVILGGNTFSTAYRGEGTQIIPVSIDNIPLIRFVFLDGQLLLTLQIFDEFNNLVLSILDNELQYVPDPWDIEFVGTRLVAREAARKILVDIDFQPPHRVVISRARLLCNGVQVLVQPNEVKVTAGLQTFALSENVKANTGGGIVVGPHPFSIGSLLRIPNVPRYTVENTAPKEWTDDTFGSDAPSATSYVASSIKPMSKE